LDIGSNTYYYSLWAHNAAGFSTTTAQRSIGGETMTFIAFIGGALLLTWISAKTMWYFRFMASILWVGLYFYWPTGLRPGTITAGSPVDQILSLLLLAMALGCLFWTFWYKLDGDGQSTSGFRIPFITRNDEDEEETPRYSQTREQRQTDYRARVKDALNGKRERRRY
jgi:type VI protein secretion system component VasK